MTKYGNLRDAFGKNAWAGCGRMAPKRKASGSAAAKKATKQHQQSFEELLSYYK